MLLTQPLALISQRLTRYLGDRLDFRPLSYHLCKMTISTFAAQSNNLTRLVSNMKGKTLKNSKLRNFQALKWLIFLSKETSFRNIIRSQRDWFLYALWFVFCLSCFLRLRVFVKDSSLNTDSSPTIIWHSLSGN